MISYLGISVDELLQAFDAAFSFSDDRSDRVYEEAYNVEEMLLDEKDMLALEAGEELDIELTADDLDADDLEDDEDFADVFVDDEGRLHSLGESLPDAGDALLGFLTDYVVADSVDEEWLTLDQARGALLALRISYPEIEEMPEVACAYSFSITRDAETGMPAFVSMKPIAIEADTVDTLTRSETHYVGVISDETVLDELFAKSGIPEGEQDFLGDAISEAVFALAQEQCGVSFDVTAFCDKVAELSAANRQGADASIGSDSAVKH